MAAATFLIFFQAFTIAPLIPALARIFSTKPTTVGIAVPAYLIPYGVKIGLGLGSLVFQLLLPAGFTTALTVFGVAALVAGALALPAFRQEVPGPHRTPPGPS